MTQQPLAAIRFPPQSAEPCPATLLSLPAPQGLPVAPQKATSCEDATAARSAIAAWLEESAARKRRSFNGRQSEAKTCVETERTRRFVPRANLLDAFTDSLVAKAKSCVQFVGQLTGRMIGRRAAQLAYVPARPSGPSNHARPSVRQRSLEGWLWLCAALLTGTCGVVLIVGVFQLHDSAASGATAAKGSAEGIATSPRANKAEPPNDSERGIQSIAGDVRPATGGVQSAVFEVHSSVAPRGAWLTGTIIDDETSPSRLRN